MIIMKYDCVGIDVVNLRCVQNFVQNLLVQDFVHIFVDQTKMNMTVTTISEFRSNAKRYVDNIINDNGTLIINRGNTAAVLISLDEYNSIKATQSILSSHTISYAVNVGVEQLKTGESIEVDIDLL